MNIFMQWPVHPRDRKPQRRPDRERLLQEHRRMVFGLAYRWYGFVNPFRDRATSAEDLAAEFMLVAVRQFPRWPRDRCAFSTWLYGVARAHARYLRQRARRKKRAAFVTGQFATFGGEEFDRFAATPDPKAREPWQILAEREPD